MLGIGIVQPVDPYLGSRFRAFVQFPCHLRKARHRTGITAQSDAVAAVDRHNGHRRAQAFATALCSQRLQRGCDFAGTGVLQSDDRARGAVAVYLSDQTANPPDIVGIVDDDQTVGVAVGGNRALLADQWSQCFQRLGRNNRFEPDDLGHHLVALGATRTDPGRLRSRAIGGLDAIGTTSRRNRDQIIGTQRRQEYLEIFRAAKRPVGNHRDLALHSAVEDEGPAGNLGRILNKRADIGIADIQRVLGRHGRRQQARTDSEDGHQPGEKATHQGAPRLTAIGTLSAPRSTSTDRRAPSRI